MTYVFLEEKRGEEASAIQGIIENAVVTKCPANERTTTQPVAK